MDLNRFFLPDFDAAGGARSRRKGDTLPGHPEQLGEADRAQGGSVDCVCFFFSCKKQKKKDRSITSLFVFHLDLLGVTEFYLVLPSFTRDVVSNPMRPSFISRIRLVSRNLT